MVGEKTIKDYYEGYKAKAAEDIHFYNGKVVAYTGLRSRLKEQIKKDYDKYIQLGITLNDYPYEFVMGVYQDGTLNRIAIKLLDKVTEEEDKKLVTNLINYSHAVKLLHDARILLDEAQNRNKLTYREYDDIVKRYYNQVIRTIADGYGYTFNYHIGTLFYNRVELKESENKILDYKATNAARKKLIAEGKKPYEKKMADIYAARGIKYDGVPYAVYKRDTSCYEYIMCNSRFLKKFYFDFEPKDYISTKFREQGLITQQALADSFKDYDELMNSNLGIKQKLAIGLIIDPTRYVKYCHYNNDYRTNKKGRFIFRTYNQINGDK